MPEAPQNSLAKFRVNELLIASAADQARRNGVTLSEFIRTAIRREVRS